jgi:GT2 family glycosyltransferase
MVDLSIVIVSWNTRDLLRECLESVYKYTSKITFEVFVVDNNSSDGSPEMVCTLFPRVNVIANDYNAGFSKANNQAIRVS